MLLYACLILLPAAALAVCHDNILRVLFDLVDADNSDGIDRPEAYAIFHAVDIDGDLRVTLQEARQELQILAPKLEGYIDGIFNLLDDDKDGFISYCDVEKDFATIDTNKDGIKSRSESEKRMFKQPLCVKTPSSVHENVEDL